VNTLFDVILLLLATMNLSFNSFMLNAVAVFQLIFEAFLLFF